VRCRKVPAGPVGTPDRTPDPAATVKPEKRRWRGLSVAVRGNADGAHRPS
jgi:hypothetical protein